MKLGEICLGLPGNQCRSVSGCCCGQSHHHSSLVSAVNGTVGRGCALVARMGCTGDRDEESSFL